MFQDEDIACIKAETLEGVWKIQGTEGDWCG